MTARVHDLALIDVILSLVPGLVERLEDGIDVADVDCGSGQAVDLMAEAFPPVDSWGSISPRPGSAATAAAERRHLTNARFAKRDAATLDGSEQLDLTFL